MEMIGKETVQHVAHLSRLALSDAELSLYSSQLAAILNYISKLNEIDTDKIPPTSHAIAGLKNVYRKDILRASLPVDEALANAPDRDGDCFKVPHVIEGK